MSGIEDISLLHNIPYFDELDPAKACARALDRPLLICFTGYTVVNGRKMEENVISNTAIQKLLSEKYILVMLMVDDKRSLPTEQQRTETFEDERIELKTYGDQWMLLEARMLDVNTQPVFVKTNAELVQIGNVLQYTSSITDFISWLEED